MARTAIATAAGVVSGTVSGPAELIMIQQQKTGSTLLGQIRDIYQRHGISTFLKGMVSPNLISHCSSGQFPPCFIVFRHG